MSDTQSTAGFSMCDNIEPILPPTSRYSAFETGWHQIPRRLAKPVEIISLDVYEDPLMQVAFIFDYLLTQYLLTLF
jgi:hypothetical protein